MLVGRVSHHVKDQNWFALGLDDLILVMGVCIGVFLGLPAANTRQFGVTQSA